MSKPSDDLQDTLRIFAMLGAMSAGTTHGRVAVMPGKKFLGAMPAADEAGLTAARADADPTFALMRSMFIHGFVDVVSYGELITDGDGCVLSFTPKGVPR